jgi:hypothetical protein
MTAKLPRWLRRTLRDPVTWIIIATGPYGFLLVAAGLDPTGIGGVSEPDGLESLSLFAGLAVLAGGTISCYVVLELRSRSRRQPGLRFNPPPNWPIPPPGWQPPANWRPDPKWPAIPQGWELWVREENSP